MHVGRPSRGPTDEAWRHSLALRNCWWPNCNFEEILTKHKETNNLWNPQYCLGNTRKHITRHLYCWWQNCKSPDFQIVLKRSKEKVLHWLLWDWQRESHQTLRHVCGSGENCGDLQFGSLWNKILLIRGTRIWEGASSSQLGYWERDILVCWERVKCCIFLEGRKSM